MEAISKRIEVIPKFASLKYTALDKEISNEFKGRYTTLKHGHSYIIANRSVVEDVILEDVFSDSVGYELLHEGSSSIETKSYNYLIDIKFKPGVTDNLGKTAQEALALHEIKTDVASGEIFFIQSELKETQIKTIAQKYLANKLIQTVEVFRADQADTRFKVVKMPKVELDHTGQVQIIDLEISERELMDLSLERCLALTTQELMTIRDHYREKKETRKQEGLPIDATDVELEILAQTWSEHCKHKIFASEITYTENEHVEHKIGNKKINSLYKSYVKTATHEIQKEREIDWLKSVFTDNAGIIRYDENVDLCVKVETHNSPSALDPYGGALTGILGVNRDILGCGMGARPIANMDVFCFADPKLPQLGDEKNLPKNIMNPEQILRGVHAGVEDGGNKSGIPTVNGAMVFDNDYAGKPLVFVGTVGVMPQQTKQGIASDRKCIIAGERIVMVGGKIGADGIHGATFSSLELNENSPATAVQIGDPLTQKRVSDFLQKAQELGLYNCITDNGAGGLSSSVGEMAELSNGAEIYLDRCPLKYPGLSPYEIMISESQERMTLSVPTQKLGELLTLAQTWNVEASDIGEFTDTGYLEVYFQKETVAKLDLAFLHDGLPQMKLNAHWDGGRERIDWYGNSDKIEPTASSLEEKVLAVLTHPNVASKESLVRRYDHEVQAATNIKPFNGATGSGVNNSGGIWLGAHGGNEDNGVLIGCGLAPKWSLYDPYYMAQVSVDEAIRNIICHGANPEMISLLDNFCWPDPVATEKNPEGPYRLAQLVRANEGLYDACKIFGTPLISGKDSMKNDYNGKNRKDQTLKFSVLPTLLVTSVGQYTPSKTQTSDFKSAGDKIFYLGTKPQELYLSTYAEIYQTQNKKAPLLDLRANKKRYEQIYKLMGEGIIKSCHDISDGGVMTSIAESCFGNDLGASISIREMQEDKKEQEVLFAENPGAMLISVSAENEKQLKDSFAKDDCFLIGEVQETGDLNIETNEGSIKINTMEYKEKWQGYFNEY